SVASETTAAQSGAVGVVRRDPMAMKPFAGYNYGDYWTHWLNLGARLKNPPRIFHVNWFRQNAAGKFLWPGYSDNLRVLEWVLDRCAGRGGAVDTPIGFIPRPGDIDTQGMTIDQATLTELTAIPNEAWVKEMSDFRKYLLQYGSRLPAKLVAEVDEVERRLKARS
ncbi:MAG TPA: phosphoenolpyruvate carboxykinase domain-containing protein, partial [Steroidobacteraceae bacterium]|nr:phosphoenolpyruvate carboxykinase domain-containing protein [Steroidobacteraceae bacterium]